MKHKCVISPSPINRLVIFKKGSLDNLGSSMLDDVVSIIFQDTGNYYRSKCLILLPSNLSECRRTMQIHESIGIVYLLALTKEILSRDKDEIKRCFLSNRKFRCSKTGRQRFQFSSFYIKLRVKRKYPHLRKYRLLLLISNIETLLSSRFSNNKLTGNINLPIQN